MLEITITDPAIHSEDRTLTYNEEFVVATIACKEMDDIIFSKGYNVYVDGKKVEDE